MLDGTSEIYLFALRLTPIQSAPQVVEAAASLRSVAEAAVGLRGVAEVDVGLWGVTELAEMRGVILIKTYVIISINS